MRKITNNLQICPRFRSCSANLCPLDPEISFRNELPKEEVCPFTIKKRSKNQKGIKLLAPDNLLKIIPESNIKMLHKRNQKRWHELHKDEKK